MVSEKTPVRVLAIHAHPDDIEFKCAGTLALLKDRGCEITIVTMTPGDKGSAIHDAKEISDIRRGEAAAAAKLLGADYFCLEFEDLAICHDNDSRQRLTEALRRARADLVITAPPVDYMSDHEITSLLVRDACFAASVPNYKTRQWEPAPLLPKIPHLYYVDAIEGTDQFGNPTPCEFIVDVSSTFERKLAMLACHASQRDWLMKQHGIDEYLEICRRWSVHQGQQIKAAHGEGFCQYKGHPYPQNNLLLELVGK